MILKPVLVRVLERLDLSEWNSYDIGIQLSRICPEMVREHRIRPHNGASKMALVFTADKLVFKWSTSHSEGANDEGLREAIYYQKAKQLGLEKFFPKTEVFTKIGKTTIICQEMVDYDTEAVPTKKQQKYEDIGKTVRLDIIRKFEQDYNEGINEGHRALTRDFNRTWLSCVISLYGKRCAKSLCDFLVDNHIDDLHGNNIGYKDDKPIILDFSGYSVPASFIEELNRTHNLI